MPDKRQEKFIKKVSDGILSIDQYPSRKKWEDACWKNIVKSEALLCLLVTPNEKRDFVMRAAILQGLVYGKSYRQIGKELWVSPQTVSGIKKAIEEKGYKSHLERKKKKQEEEKNNPVFFRHDKIRKRRVRTKFGTISVSF
jgi:uncharacterized protein YerC